MKFRQFVLASFTFAFALGLASAKVAHADQLSVSFTSSPTANGRYAPRNVLAVWVEDQNGGFVRTLVRYANRRAKYLRAWNAKAQDIGIIGGMPDVITGATRSNHSRLTATWDFTDLQGNIVADGNYVVRMELTDWDSPSPSGNNEGTFQVTKSGSSSEQTGGDNGGFHDVTIQYAPGNTDPASPDLDCGQVNLCIDNDGCCLPDCVYEVDNDCDPSTAREAAAGCAIGSDTPGPSLAWLGFAAAILWSLRRRRASRPGN